MRGVAKSDYELIREEMRQLKRENIALRAQNEELFNGLVAAERDMGECLNNGKLPAWSLDCVRAVISKVS